MPIVGCSHKPGQIPIANEDFQQRAERQHNLYKSLGGKCEKFKGFKCLRYKYEFATPPTCDDSCVVCTEQFVPTNARDSPLTLKRVVLHSDQEATSIIQNLITTMQSDYLFVQSKIQTHGNAIAKRWQKKTCAKREQFLRNAVPDLALKRNEDIEGVFQAINDRIESMHNRVSKEALERQQNPSDEPYLAPFLNIESLSEDPMRLLALLHHRAHAHPSEWISFDRGFIQTYFNQGHLQCAYNPRCVMIQGPEFGSLVQWSRDAAHRWQMIGYPLARQLLRVQAKISGFLRPIVTALLDPSEQEAPQGRDAWDHLVATFFKHEDSIVTPSAYCNQVFAPPPKFDLCHILQAVHTRMCAAIDEAQLMQADPIYLRCLLRQLEIGPVYELMDEKARQRMLYMSSIQPMLNRNAWGVVAGTAAELLRYSLERRQGILYLPKQYEDCLRSVEAALRLQFETLIHELLRFLADSRAFSRHYQNGQQTTDPEIAYRTDPFFWALTEIVAQNIKVNWPAARCLSFIEEHLAKSSQKERARIDQQMYDQLSDIAFVDEILTAIKAHRSYTPLSHNSKEAKPLKENLYKNKISGVMLELFYGCSRDIEVQDALQAFLRAPMPRKASNKEKLEYNNVLHEKFTEYWEVFRSKALSNRAYTKQDPSEQQTVERKFKHYGGGQAHIFEAKQDAIKAAIRREGIPLTLSILPLPRTNTNLEQRARPTDATTTSSNGTESFVSKSNVTEHQTGREIAKKIEPKMKTKTRATYAASFANDFASMDIEPLESSTQLAKLDTIAVKQTSVDFFRQMFSSVEAPERSPKWVDLLDAMVDAGMSATHGGGSAVVFQDEKKKKGSIVLHKPHPDPTVDHVMLKTIGKRLTKWFGWDEDTFVERERD